VYSLIAFIKRGIIMSFSFDIQSQTRSVRTAVYEKLKKAILEGYYKPGCQLNERQLARQFNVSTTPLKEALRHLEEQGLIETRPRVGSFVALDVMVSIEEINLIRGAIEGVAARLAAMKITAAEIAQFDQVIKEMKLFTTTKNLPKLVEINDQFHKLISHCAKNNYIAKQVEATRSFDLKKVLSHPDELELAFNDHYLIYTKIINRDPDGAEAAIRSHINRNVDFIRQKRTGNSQ